MNINTHFIKHFIFLISFFLIMVVAVHFSMGLQPSAAQMLFNEGGVIEIASAIGYLICLMIALHLWRKESLRSHWYVYVLLTMMGLRELDFDKKFTETGILKSKFLFSDNVGFTAKLIGLAVLLLLLSALITWARRHFVDFCQGVLKLQASDWCMGFVFALLVTSKLIDGAARKLRSLDVTISENLEDIFWRLEETFELGVPMMLSYAIFLYWRSNQNKEDV